MNKPLTHKKLKQMYLDTIVLEFERAFETRGILKKEYIGKNSFTQKYFKKFKFKGTTTQKTMD